MTGTTARISMYGKRWSTQTPPARKQSLNAAAFAIFIWMRSAPLTTRTVDHGRNNSRDREHVWPKSRGFPKERQIGYSDLHHLRPADRNLNGTHSNYGYDIGGAFVNDKLSSVEEVPTGARIDRPNNSFEPPDRAKGQIARMLFYMAVRYEAGNDGPYENMPDLTLKNENGRANEPWIGDLCTLIAWNNMFAPSDFERSRNDRVMVL